MRLLVATEGDVEGQVYAPVVEEMLGRGHDVDVFSRYADIYTFNVEFLQRGIPVHDISKLWGREKEYDFALVYREVINALRYNRVPMAYIVFGPYSSQYRTIAAQFFHVDLMFVASEYTKRSLIRSGYDGEILVTGLPKYDSLYGMEKRDENLIVVPDTPNKPRGRRRKKYFDIIAEVARRNPDYEVLIKPRFLLSDRWENSGFLLGVEKHMAFYKKELKEKLPNLKVLDEYISMNELCSRASLVFSTPSSAIFPQMLLEKPTMVVQDSVATKELIHDAMYRCNMETYHESGCCVWMEEILQLAPKGLTASSEWVRKAIGTCDGKAANRVADGLEEAAEGLGRIGFFPKLFDQPDNLGAKIREWRRGYDVRSSSEKEIEAKQAQKQIVLRGVATIRSFAGDTTPDLHLEKLFSMYESMADTLLYMDMEEPSSFEAFYRIIVSLYKLSDQIWNFRINSRYFEHNLQTEVSDLFCSIGLLALEENEEIMVPWRDLSNRYFGYTLLDFIVDGPTDMPTKYCQNYARMFAGDSLPRLAGVYAAEFSDTKDGEKDFLLLCREIINILLEKGVSNKADTFLKVLSDGLPKSAAEVKTIFEDLAIAQKFKS